MYLQFMLEWLKLDHEPIYIYDLCQQGNIMSMSIWPHPFHKHLKWYFCKRKNGATDLKLGTQTQLDSSNKMGWFPSGHTSTFLCIRLKNMPKMVLLKSTDFIRIQFCFKVYNSPQSRNFCNYSSPKGFLFCC